MIVFLHHPFAFPLARLAGTVLLAASTLPGSVGAAVLTLTVQGHDGKPIADAVVGVLLRGQRSMSNNATVQISQRERQFQPFISAVQTGTSVQFPNFDTVRHHVYSFSPIRRFELKLYAGTPATPVVFDKAGVAALGCNIHDRMTAWVVVMDTPLLARTDAAGQAVFELPAGEHRLQGWHAALGDAAAFVEQTLTVGASAQSASLVLPMAARR